MRYIKVEAKKMMGNHLVRRRSTCDTAVVPQPAEIKEKTKENEKKEETKKDEELGSSTPKQGSLEDESKESKAVAERVKIISKNTKRIVSVGWR